MRLSEMTTVQLMMVATFPLRVGANFNFCTPLANNTWAAMVQAIRDSYKIAVLCPFRISGDGCPFTDEYPEGLVLGRDDDSGMIIECDIHSLNPYDDDRGNTNCILDCPGRHLTVGSSSEGLTLSNMILSGATNSSIVVEQNGTLDVGNTLFENNTAIDSNGGAIKVLEGSTVSVEFSTLKNNQGIVGGAIHAEQGCTIRVYQSLFSENRAIVEGGAIAFDSDSIVDISFSAFERNEAIQGGALYLAAWVHLSTSRSTFEGNMGSAYGGAIFTEGASTITESRFFGNIGGEGGGAINCGREASTTLIGNIFIKNRSNGRGPAVYDRYNTGVKMDGNTGCQNRVPPYEISSAKLNLHCDGVYSLTPFRKLRSCKPFQTQCTDSTDAPTVATSMSPSWQPSTFPMNEAGGEPSLPTGRPASDIPSSAPTSAPSVSYTSSPSNTQGIRTLSPQPTVQQRSASPSSSPTLGAVMSTGSSPIPSDAPSLIPSDTPSLSPSD